MIVKAVVGLALGAVLLAGCTGTSDPEPSASATSTAPSPTATASATPSASPTGASPTPSPSALPGVPAVSAGGTIEARVPEAWSACDGTAGLGAPNALDVLGAWSATGGCGSADTLIEIESLESPDASLTAEGYYDAAFSSMEDDSTLTVNHDTFLNPDGLEVLLVEVRAADGGFEDGATFIVFAGRDVVVGKLASAGALDDAVVADFRGVAESLVVR